MQQTQGPNPSRLRKVLSHFGEILSHFIQHVRDDWPATIFVAAALALLDRHVGWLDAINAHSFVVIGNAAEMPKPSGQTSGKALVVLIDQLAAQSRYLERSPLDRCELKRDIHEVYAAMRRFNQQPAANPTNKLALLVIDLDLSPARWLATEPGSKTPEADCEKALHKLIVDEANVDEAKNKSYPIRTVLMQPFDKLTADSYDETHPEWKALKATPNVAFGSAALPLEYGLVIKQYCDADTLAAMALAWSPKIKSSKNCVDKAIERKLEARTYTEPIDPRTYLTGVVPIAIGVTDTQQGTFKARLDRTLAGDRGANAPSADNNFRAVFFGAAFGEEDAFLTPLGELYGVEIHAASYLSLIESLRTDHRIAEFMVDIVFGFLFGCFIAWCWERYFELKLSNDSDDRLWAPFWLVGLAAGVSGIAAGLTVVSWLLLVYGGIWASPIPMAVGMLLESFVSGSVAQGIEVASKLKGDVRPSQPTFRKSIDKFFRGDFLALRKKGKDESARLVATRVVIWTAVVVGAVLSALLD